MGRCRVVQPDAVRLPLSDGDWIEVKKRLNSGEQRAMFARMYLAGIDGQLRVNPIQQGVAKVTAYLLDWSFVGPDGKVIPIADRSVEAVAAALDTFDPESFVEIRAAIDAHEEAMYQEREAEKNERDGVKNGSAISPSPSEQAGQSTMSVN
jgi:hypothetical protein